MRSFKSGRSAHVDLRLSRVVWSAFSRPFAKDTAVLILGMIAALLAAALLLFVTSPNKRSVAIKQGALPFIAVAALGVAVLL